MKFIINSSILLKELQKLGGVINSNNTLPILDNFLFEINNNNMNIIASDLETTMISKIQAETDTNGKITIPARILIDTLKTLPNQPLTFIIDEDNYGVEISSSTGNYKLAGNNAEEFPKIPELSSSKGTSIKAEILVNAINKTLFASGNDELRPAMSGMYCELSSEKVIFVATDAHKLVKHIRSNIKTEETSSFILPKKPLNILKNSLTEDNIVIEYNDTNALFTFNNNTIIL